MSACAWSSSTATRSSALPALFERLRGLGERFVVLCDDLSFEEGAAAAKSLKSALEGGVAGPPENALFVATSNRRHLMPRDHVEGRGLIAAAEDAEEEVSVSDRFGLWIGFPPMDQAAYLAAVRAYAERFDLVIDDLEARALVWSQLRGARSGPGGLAVHPRPRRRTRQTPAPLIPRRSRKRRRRSRKRRWTAKDAKDAKGF